MINTEEKAKVVAADYGTELIKFLAALAILHQDDLNKRMNRITATCKNGCFDKMDDSHHHHPGHTLPKWMFSQNRSFIIQIILAAK